MPWTGIAAGLASGVLNGAFGLFSSKKSANRTEAMNKEYAQNAHQWEVNDLRKAGLNPILSAGGSGAHSAGLNAPMATSAFDIASGMQAEASESQANTAEETGKKQRAVLDKTLDQINKGIEKTDADIKNVEQDTKVKQATEKSITQGTKIKQPLENLTSVPGLGEALASAPLVGTVLGGLGIGKRFYDAWKTGRKAINSAKAVKSAKSTGKILPSNKPFKYTGTRTYYRQKDGNYRDLSSGD